MRKLSDLKPVFSSERLMSGSPRLKGRATAMSVIGPQSGRK